MAQQSYQIHITKIHKMLTPSTAFAACMTWQWIVQHNYFAKSTRVHIFLDLKHKFLIKRFQFTNQTENKVLRYILDKSLPNAACQHCRMLLQEHSAVLACCIQQSPVCEIQFKSHIFVFSFLSFSLFSFSDKFQFDSWKTNPEEIPKRSDYYEVQY